MQKKLDYRAVAKDARASFAAHREVIIAIAGFFIFMANWIAGYLALRSSSTALTIPPKSSRRSVDISKEIGRSCYRPCS